jgi:hypothetical protein
MKLEERVRKMIADGILKKCPETLQGVEKIKIRRLLEKLSRATDDMTDAVFALLDNQQANLFSSAGISLKFSDGASTGHIACHVGIYQRGKNKLDREGRDYWLKPLWSIGALEKITYEGGRFVSGHPKPKSPNSAYRIAPEFLSLLKLKDVEFEREFSRWSSADNIRDRLVRQAAAELSGRSTLHSAHKQLIADIQEHYVPIFLPDFSVIFVDEDDGDRISKEERALLDKIGVNIELGDAMPDVLLFNRKTDALWAIEAVCSDGEVDHHKFESLSAFARRNSKSSIGFTTVYPDWKTAAARQGRMKNIAPGSFLWIRDDASRSLRVDANPVII